MGVNHPPFQLRKFFKSFYEMGITGRTRGGFTSLSKKFPKISGNFAYFGLEKGIIKYKADT